MFGPWVHDIHPIIATIGGLHLWWYGLSYSLGFLNAHVFLRRNRARLGLSLADVYTLSLLMAAGVLIGGRALVVFRHEWSFSRDHLSLVPARSVSVFPSEVEHENHFCRGALGERVVGIAGRRTDQLHDLVRCGCPGQTESGRPCSGRR